MFLTGPMQRSLVALVIMVVASPVWAQRKPEPPAWPPEEEPRESVVSDEFLEAYKAAGAPRLLVYTHVDALAHHKGDELYEKGVADRFNQRLAHRFTHPDIALVNLAAAKIRSEEEVDTLARTDQTGAARLLAREAEADVVLFVTLREQFGREDETKYAGTYVVLDIVRGQRIASWSWDMSPDSDDGQFTARRLGKYAAAISKRVSRDMAIYFPKAPGGTVRRFTLRFTGVPDVGTAALRDALREAPGVVEILRVDFSATRKSTLVTVALKYRGPALDLAMAARQVAEDVLNMDVWFNRTSEGVIALEAIPKPMIVEESLLSGDPPTPENAEQMGRLRERFTRAYKSQASPTIAVTINKEAGKPAAGLAVQKPTSVPEHGDNTGVMVVVTPEIYIESDVVKGDTTSDMGGVGSTRADDKALKDALELLKRLTDDDLLKTRAMEDRVLERFGKLRTRLKDLQQAWRLLAKEKAFEEKVWDSAQLSRMLGEKAGADIIISGAGRVVRRADAVEVHYTFRAYTVSSATILGAAQAQRVLHGEGDLDGVTDALAAEVVGKLAYQMMENWEPAGRIAVSVTNVSSAPEVQKVADLLTGKIKGIVRATNRGFDSSAGEAVGYLEIEYEGQYEDLLRAMDRPLELPFDLDNASSDREHIKIKLTGKLPVPDVDAVGDGRRAADHLTD